MKVIKVLALIFIGIHSPLVQTAELVSKAARDSSYFGGILNTRIKQRAHPEEVLNLMGSGAKPTATHLESAAVFHNEYTPSTLSILLKGKGYSLLKDSPDTIKHIFDDRTPNSLQSFAILMENGGDQVILDNPAFYRTIIIAEEDLARNPIAKSDDPRMLMGEKIQLFNLARQRNNTQPSRWTQIKGKLGL